MKRRREENKISEGEVVKWNSGLSDRITSHLYYCHCLYRIQNNMLMNAEYTHYPYIMTAIASRKYPEKHRPSGYTQEGTEQQIRQL